jgi:hypothetical protein
MSALNLTIANDQLNLNANRAYKETGLPSAPPDNRSFTEKYADIERLRVQLYSEFNQLTDGTNANKIVSGLSPDEVQFIVSKLPLIKRDMNELYSTGFPAQVFKIYLNRLMRKLQLTSGVELGLQQETGEDILMSLDNILEIIPSRQDLADLRQAVLGATGGQRVAEIINLLSEALPNLDLLGEISQAQQAEILEKLNYALDNLPSKADLRKAVEQLYISIASQSSRETTKSLQRLEELVKLTPQQLNELQTVKEQMKRDAENEPIEAEVEFLPTLEELKSGRQQFPTLEEWKTGKIKDAKGRTIKAFKRPQKQSVLFVLSERGEIPYSNYDLTKGANQTVSEMDRIYEEWYNTKVTEPVIAEPVPEGSGMKKRRNRMRGKGINVVKPDNVDMSKGFQKVPSYVPFGKYLVNSHRLDNDNILMVRTAKGGAIKEIPATKITPKLSGVFKRIIDGGLLDFDGLSDLSAEDKQMLYNVSSKAQIAHKLSIPKPNKDEEEIENNRFIILKGEIMAGNDNPKLVKELKTMIVRFMNQRKIPRGEAQDILLDLASLGY